MARARLDAAATENVVLALLTEAAEAHGIHEKDDLGGVHDEQWPSWYAAHMVRALADRGYVLVAKRPGLAESFDLSGDVAGWDDWL